MKELMTEWRKFLIKEGIDEYLNDESQKLIQKGYKEVNEINLPDGVYGAGGGGYQLDIMSPDGKNSTGYSVMLTNGIRGMYSGTLQIVGKKINDARYQVYKIFFNWLANLME